VAADLARGRLAGWAPDVLHAHDWQAGLAPAYLALEGGPRPGTVFTVHNLAFQGFFPAWRLAELGLPAAAFRTDGLEFYGGIAFLKAGLYYADRLTTVSPGYAREIRTDARGEGGLLRARAADLVGIVNGIDTAVWDPARDPHLPAAYPPRTAEQKARNKAALQARLGLAATPDAPLLAVVSRLTWRKGMDLLLAALPELLAQGGQLAVLGGGEADLEAGFRAAARHHPGRVGCRIGYDEGLAHLVQGGADTVLAPSRDEPCGLVQLVGLRYGTIPLVARVGGLADTVIDANEAALEDGVATGFQLAPVEAWALADAIRRAVEVYRRPGAWGRLVARAMTREVGWGRVARRYLDPYPWLVAARAAGQADRS
jgi:starch synthase